MAPGMMTTRARILTNHVLDAVLCGLSPWRGRRGDGQARLRQHHRDVAACRAAGATIARAELNGLGIVCHANTGMTGRSAWYCEIIVRPVWSSSG